MWDGSSPQLGTADSQGLQPLAGETLLQWEGAEGISGGFIVAINGGWRGGFDFFSAQFTENLPPGSVSG